MDQRDKWNRKHKERLKSIEQPLPNERLLTLAPYLSGGTALDLACGLGANSLYLAERNYEVTAVDFSEDGIDYVANQAAGNRLKVNTLIADLTKFETLPLNKNSFDLVVMTYYLDRRIFPFVKDLVKDNGYVFIETYYDSPKVENHRVSKEYRLEAGELLHEFGDWEIVYYEEDEGTGRVTVLCQKQDNY